MAKKATTKNVKVKLQEVKNKDFVTVKALPGSLIITPIELKAFKALRGLDLKKQLKSIQAEIYL